MNTMFTPMIPNTCGYYENIPWPEELQMTPIGRHSGLWGFDHGRSYGWWAGWVQFLFP
jgi:hypothetical protein